MCGETAGSFLKVIISTWKYRASMSQCADMNKHIHTCTSVRQMSCFSLHYWGCNTETIKKKYFRRNYLLFHVIYFCESSNNADNIEDDDNVDDDDNIGDDGDNDDDGGNMMTDINISVSKQHSPSQCRADEAVPHSHRLHGYWALSHS